MSKKGPPKGTVNNPLGKNQWNTVGGKVGKTVDKTVGTVSGAIRGAKTMVRGLPGTKGGGALGRARRSKMTGFQTAKLVSGAAIKGAIGGARMGSLKSGRKYEFKGKRIGTSVGKTVSKIKSKAKSTSAKLESKAKSTWSKLKTKYKTYKNKSYNKRVGPTSPSRRYALGKKNKARSVAVKCPSTYGTAGARMMASVNRGIPSTKARSSGPTKRYVNKSKIKSLPEITVVGSREYSI